MPLDGRCIAACARGWLGTRFQHQGRLKKTNRHKGGVDCLGLLVGVAAELGLEDKHGRPFCAADMVHYSHAPDTAHLRAVLQNLMDEQSPQAVETGDVLLLDVDGRPQHLAIVSDFGGGAGMIHAYAPAKCVVEHALDAWWQQRIVAAFRVV